MAKKKKKTYRRRSTKKKAVRKRKSKPAGVAGGAVLTGYDIFGNPIINRVKGTWTTDYAVNIAKVAAKDTKNYYPLIGGVIISASPKLPLVRMLARPLDRAIKDFTKGKWRL